MARRLTVLCAAVVGLSDCDEEFCAARVDDPIAAFTVSPRSLPPTCLRRTP